MEPTDADRALAELTDSLRRESTLLAWTIRWCPSGEADWRALWDAAREPKPMLNLLVMLGRVREPRVVAAAPAEQSERDSRVRLEHAGGTTEFVPIHAVAGLVRRSFTRPLLTDVIELARAR